jgi:tetratricopeptide (TPR) repeat protein
VQALLLTGMAYRLLNDHQRAREHLDRALSVADGTDEPSERERIEWAVTLAWLERVRNEADDGRFDDALENLAEFRGTISTKQGPDGFGLRIVAAFLERSVYRLRADLAEQSGKTSQARQCRQRAWQAVARLARVEPDRRDEIYAALYDVIGTDADPAQLDPLERCAVIAGLLSDASREGNTSPSLDRAIEVAARFLAERPAGAESLVPEVLYNMAVAEYRRNRPAAAARRFLEVARDHASFDTAQQAAAFAVQLAAELYSDPTLREHPGVRDLYEDALALLVDRYPQTDAGRYWRFYYAQLLEESGDFDRASGQYALVDKTHEHHIEALFYRTRCVAAILKRESSDGTQDTRAHQQRTNDFFTIHREFVARATSELNAGPEPDRAASLRSLLARARLSAAEVQVMPQTDRPAQALETLRGFEDHYPDEKSLAGRVWRGRLLAYEELGRLDEATEAIPAYIAADPQNAGPTLQSLYVALTEDVDRLESSGATSSAQRKAGMALVLAEQIHEWAKRADRSSTGGEPRVWTVQLAEANLRAGRYARARRLFELLLPTTQKPETGQPENDVRLIFGYAEALYHLGDFGEALPKFNRLATGLPASDPIRWKALLRDLQCRTALDHPARGVVKVIQQQEQLYPYLGGPSVKPQLERLLRANERRIDDGS